MKEARVLGNVPTCPNHSERLDVSYLEIKEGKGQGVCPVSGVTFMFEVDLQTKEMDKFGNMVKSFLVKGDE